MGSDADWLTWPQAAELVGCGVSTIDWHTRTGRIAHRPWQGTRPSLERASVEEFARWWAADQEERARRRAARESRSAARRPAVPPEPEGWLSSKVAAAELGVSSKSAVRFAAEGVLDGRLHDGRWWFTSSSVAELRVARGRWISHVEASRLVGSSPSVVGKAARRGEIVSREQAGTVLPSLDRASVLAWAQQRAAVEAERERRRERRRASSGPPADGEVWLDTVTAALVMGFTPKWVQAMARREQLPAVRRGQRFWFRRRDVEQAAAARALRTQWGR